MEAYYSSNDVKLIRLRAVKPRLLLALALVVLALPGLALLTGCGASSTDTSNEPKAAIIDQLDTLQPNRAFINEATTVLKGYGFTVDLYQGDEVTVDFFRKLPSHDYKLILFRVHSGHIIQGSHLVEETFLFTNEPYSQEKHVEEQRSSQMVKARTSEQQPFVFAVRAKFVTESMKGKFDDTVIIMMGCSALRQQDMAQAFVGKGASTYMGWDASVQLDYVDGAALNLISNLCIEGMTVEQAVLSTMNDVGLDPITDARLYGYPKKVGNQTIAELM